MAIERFAPTVYLTRANLRSSPGPLVEKFAICVDGPDGIYRFAIGDTTADDDWTAITPQGGAAGTWLLIDHAVAALADLPAAAAVGARIYVTGRRIIFFEPVTPVYTRQRALFWTEALKAKAYPDSFLGQIFSLHILTVEPQAGSSKDVTIRNVWYAHDLANYIDKILYTVKNTPNEVSSLKPFVAKPKGHRD
jgi:hypothetical protein